MFQKIFFGIIQVFLSLFSLSILSQEHWSLKQCVEIALQNNPNVHRAELQYEKDKIDKRQAWQNALPVIEGNAGHSWSQGRSIDPTTNQFIEQTISSGNASIGAGMYLFNGFRIFHDIRKQAAAEKAGNLQVKAQKESLILDVIESYITVLTAKDLLQQAENQLLLSREQFEQAEILNDEGNIDPGDYHDLKGAFNETKNAITSAEQNLFHSRIRLAGLLHIPEESLPELQILAIKENVISTKSELFETGKNRPFYALWEWRIREAKENIRLAQSAYYPSVSLSAGMNSRYSSSSELEFWEQNKNNLGKYISLNVNIPIFNGFTIRNNVKKAKLDFFDVEWQKEIVKNDLREATSKAVFDLAIAEKNYQNLVNQEENYRESFRIAQTKFDLGASNSVMLLTAKNKWETSKNQLVIKQYEWILQQYLNAYYAGELEIKN